MSKATIQGLIGTKQVKKVTYDFAKDGGANATPIDLMTLSENTILHDFWFEVETQPVSAGAATLEVGITGDDTDGAMKQLGKAALPADYVSNEDDKGAYLFDSVNKASDRYKVTTEKILSLLIGTADLSAGKIHFYAEYSAGY
jgi:hypothetical protein